MLPPRRARPTWGTAALARRALAVLLSVAVVAGGGSVASGGALEASAEQAGPSGGEPAAAADDGRGPTDPGVWDVAGVERLAGSDRVATAVAASQAGWADADAAVLASAAEFPDALAAAPLAGHLDAPVLLTWPDRLPDAVAHELARLEPSTLAVAGGEDAVAADVVASAGDAAGVERVVRHAGADRWETAAELARATGTAVREVALVSGTDFADALAVGGLADAEGPLPVLLATAGELPPATAAALEDLAPARVTVIGGPAAVSADVVAELETFADEVARVDGSTRFDTSVAVLQAARDRGDGPLPVVAASGTDFPDALAAGALAARLGGQVALTPPDGLTDALDAWLRGADDVDVPHLLGGRAAADAHVRSELAAAAAAAPRPATTHATAAGFRGVAGPLPAETAEAMRGSSWEPGCPVGLEDLALLDVIHRTFAGDDADGVMVVHRDVAHEVLEVLAVAYDADFPLERMRLIDDYDADDDASMDDNNSSSFNCRAITGGSRWSEHAYGTAVDLNPVQNPYARDGTVLPPAGEAYLERDDVRPGMLVRPGPVTGAFDDRGWEWGGDWRTPRDWMHFEVPTERRRQVVGGS